MRIVVAIGGNALLSEDSDGTWESQLESARVIARQLVALRDAGHEIVLTHGNGPQVGLLLLQQSLGADEAPLLPLDVLIAMTQGQAGYLLETAISDVRPDLPVLTVLTRVVVDPATDWLMRKALRGTMREVERMEQQGLRLEAPRNERSVRSG